MEITNLKEYSVFSKIIIALCICLIIATLINFFTGIINPTMPGSSHVFCSGAFSLCIYVTITLEKERIKKAK